MEHYIVIEGVGVTTHRDSCEGDCGDANAFTVRDDGRLVGFCLVDGEVA